jgi:hypothetical protein
VDEENKNGDVTPRNGNLEAFVDVERLAANRKERVTALEMRKMRHLISDIVDVPENSKPLSTPTPDRKNPGKERF